MSMPVIPILPYARVRMIAIYEQQVDLAIPIVRCGGAEFLDPDDLPLPATFDRPVRREFHCIDVPHAAEMEWVDQPQGSARRHCLA